MMTSATLLALHDRHWEAMIADADYVELLVTHQPAKPRSREELNAMTTLLESFAENEEAQSPAMERFIETLMALVMQYEEEIEPTQASSAVGTLKYLMEERGLRQVDLVPILGSKSYVSQIMSGHRPIGREAAEKLAEYFQIGVQNFR